MTTSPASAASSQQASIEAALLVLKSMGLSLTDLLSAGSSNRQPVPTFAEYVPVVAATLTGSTLRAYSSYWKRTVEQWGDRHLDEPTPSEVKQLAVRVKANAVQRRNSRGRQRSRREAGWAATAAQPSGGHVEPPGGGPHDYLM